MTATDPGAPPRGGEAAGGAPARRHGGGSANPRRGKQAERDVVNAARRNGFPHAERVVRTGYRTRTRVTADEGDVALCPGVIVQVKTYTDAGRMERAIPAWMAETEQQRQAAEADIALLVVRRNGTTDVTEWWCWLPLVAVRCLQTGDDAHCEPETWSRVDQIPVRTTFGDAVALLHSGGYGDPP